MKVNRFLHPHIFLHIALIAMIAAGMSDPMPSMAQASQLEVSGLFSDNMVLQKQSRVPVWGWAPEGETVTVTFRGQKVSAKSVRGKWQVALRELAAGGPDTLTITCGRTLQFTNVLVGEVWLCSGQSNMGRTLARSFESQPDIAAATNAMIRFYKVPKEKADSPRERVAGHWETCTPETAAQFSAVGYYFGRDLHRARQVPIGLMESDWGGTPAAAWTSWSGLEANPRLKSEILDAFPAARQKFQQDMAAYQAAKDEAQRNNKPFKQRAPYQSWRPGELYNAMIAPLIPFAIKGVIWYQGEANVSRAHQYRELFPALVRDWRKNWGIGDFPFLCVQLAPFRDIQPEPGDSALAELREAQLRTTQLLPRMAIAVTTDVGDEKDIHPAKKQPVGARLALAARGIAYGEKITYSGPVLKKMRIKGSQAVLTFEHVGNGLTASDPIKGFSICGSDGKFVSAEANIQSKDTVLVWSDHVSRPVAVRYGWADYPVVNLTNSEGLPASPFRTDDFPMVTDPNRPR